MSISKLEEFLREEERKKVALDSIVNKFDGGSGYKMKIVDFNQYASQSDESSEKPTTYSVGAGGAGGAGPNATDRTKVDFNQYSTAPNEKGATNKAIRTFFEEEQKFAMAKKMSLEDVGSNNNQKIHNSTKKHKSPDFSEYEHELKKLKPVSREVKPLFGSGSIEVTAEDRLEFKGMSDGRIKTIKFTMTNVDPFDRVASVRFGEDVGTRFNSVVDSLVKKSISVDASGIHKMVKEVEAVVSDPFANRSGFFKSIFASKETSFEKICDLVDSICKKLSAEVSVITTALTGLESVIKESKAAAEEVENHVVAGKSVLRSKTLEFEKLNVRKTNGEMTAELFDQISAYQRFEKRVDDLQIMVVSYGQTAAQVVMVRESLHSTIDLIRAVVDAAVPEWKKALLSTFFTGGKLNENVSIIDRKKFEDITNKVLDTVSKIVK